MVFIIDIYVKYFIQSIVDPGAKKPGPSSSADVEVPGPSTKNETSSEADLGK